MADPIVEVTGLKNNLGGKWVHSDVSFTINQGEICAIIGGSGSGKTTILRSLLMLLKPSAGDIRIFGKNILLLNSETEANKIRHRWGILFQQSALFSAMTVLENVMYPIQELSHLSQKMIQELALLKIALVGLPEDAADDDNPDISDYSGRMETQLFYPIGSHQLALTWRNNLKFNRSVPNRSYWLLEWAFPLAGQLHGYVQAFDGYGDSLQSYNFKNRGVAVGVSLVNWQ